MRRISAFIIIAAFALALAACSSGRESAVNNIDKPQQASTIDELYVEANDDAIEDSENVYGRRYNATLEEFTGRYNELMLSAGGVEYLNYANWKKSEGEKTDANGVVYENYYYDANKIEFTASVEKDTQKLMNIGCGTTLSIFVSSRGEESYSDIVLMKSAVMAAAVCGYSSDMIDPLQDVFYRTTFEEVNSLIYDGNVYSLSIREENDSEKSVMLFRCFPISSENEREWNIQSYESYVATAPKTEPEPAEDDGQ